MDSDREYLAAGYALDTLEPEEMAEAREIFSGDQAFRDEVASYTETLAMLATSDEPVTPSEETDRAILAIPGRESGPAAGPTDVGSSGAGDGADADGSDIATGADGVGPVGGSRAGRGETGARGGDDAPRRRSRAATMFALAASVLLVAAAVLGGIALNAHQDREELRETLIAMEAQGDQADQLLGAPDLASTHVEAGDGSSVTVAYSVSQQLILVTPHDMDAPAAGEDLQMWVIDEDGAHDAGLMGVEASSLVSDREFADDAAVGITVEPEGGSPEPTSDPIIVAEL